MSGKRITAEHGIIYARGNDTLFGYFGWPSVCHTSEHGLMAAASGFRTGHVDPFGKGVCFFSEDDGKSWGAPLIVNDTPVDDRDTGLLDLGNGRALMSWFASDTRALLADKTKAHYKSRQYRMDFHPIVEQWDDSVVAANVGAFTRIRESSGKWGKRRKSLVSAPHGPIRLNNGSVLYLGNECRHDPGNPGGIGMGNIAAALSRDDGESWRIAGHVPELDEGKFYEAHAVELPSGKIIGALRHQPDFTIYLTHSDDGGATWSFPTFLAAGSPPQLIRHSSGALILSYSWRGEKPGQRMAFSTDDGRSWECEWILRDDGPDGDLGYPATVELADGTLCTVYYQKVHEGDLNCALMFSRWTLPAL